MIKILTDSTADLTAQEADELGVSVVPLTVTFGEQHYVDGVDLPVETFYDMLVESQKLPTTSQPSPDSFLTHFEAARDNNDTIICILISEHLSGTCQSAKIAKEVCGYENIFIVNSLNVTLGLQLLVRYAVKLLKSGKPAESIVAALESEKHNVCLYAIVDDLKYLRKGGRLSSAAAVAGGLLGIKPVVEVAAGKVGVAGKARGLPGAYTTIFKLVEKNGGINEKFPVCVGYTGRRHGVEPFMRFVTQNLHLQKPRLSAIGTVIGTHAGPGACGIAFIKNGEA